MSFSVAIAGIVIQFVEYFGEMLFRSDLCVADAFANGRSAAVHERCAMYYYNSTAAESLIPVNKTYFVLSGTSLPNKSGLQHLLLTFEAIWCCLTTP